MKPRLADGLAAFGGEGEIEAASGRALRFLNKLLPVEAFDRETHARDAGTCPAAVDDVLQLTTRHRFRALPKEPQDDEVKHLQVDLVGFD